jgi:hypothetical protein
MVAQYAICDVLQAVWEAEPTVGPDAVLRRASEQLLTEYAGWNEVPFDAAAELFVSELAHR